MAKSKFFRCFVAGSTISDGRVITPEMIDQIVETFNTETYTPRINVEHIKGYSPEPPFNGYGDVIAVKAQTDDITIDGKVEKRKALYAQVEANAQLLKLAKADQKPFPSVELTPSYAGIEKIGLVGLAFTDSPASIATQKLQFSRSAPGTFHAHGTDAVEFGFDAAPVEAGGIAAAIEAGFSKIAAKFSGGKPEEPKKDEPKPPANDNGFDAKAFATDFGAIVAEQIAAAVKPSNDALATIQTEFADLKAKLEKTPDTRFTRGPATGASLDAQFVTDC